MSVLFTASTGNGQINWGDVTFADGATKLSVSLFVKQTQTLGGSFKSVVRKDGTYTPLQIDSSNNLTTVIWSAGQFLVSTAPGNLGLNLNQWTHYSTVWAIGTASNKVEFYIDGAYIGRGNKGIFAGVPNVANPLVMGATELRNEDFGGELKEVAIWTSELTTAEIYNLAKSNVKRLPLQIQRENLVFYAPLDEAPHNYPITGITFHNLVDNTEGTGYGNTSVVGQADSFLSFPVSPSVITNIAAAAGATLTKALSESISVSDALTFNFFKVLSEAITETDSLRLGFSKILSQAISETDALTKTTTKVFTESISVTDALSLLFQLVLSDNVTVTESIVKSFFKVLSDNVTETDSLVKNTFKVLSDSITVTDTEANSLVAAAVSQYIRQRYITARRGMKPHEIQEMKRWIGNLTIEDINQMQKDMREMMKDWE